MYGTDYRDNSYLIAGRRGLGSWCDVLVDVVVMVLLLRMASGGLVPC